MLKCSSLSGRYRSKCTFEKEAINFDILYLYHSSSGITLNLLIAGLLSDESRPDAILEVDDEEKYLLFLFLFLFFMECFLFLIEEELF